MNKIEIFNGKIQLNSWQTNEDIIAGRQIFYIQNNELIYCGRINLAHNQITNNYETEMITTFSLSEIEIENYIWELYYIFREGINNRFSYDIDIEIVKNELESLIIRVDKDFDMWTVYK